MPPAAQSRALVFLSPSHPSPGEPVAVLKEEGPKRCQPPGPKKRLICVMSTIPHRSRAQAALAKRHPTAKPSAPNSTVFAYDGTTYVGHIIEHEGRHLAVDPQGHLVGSFATRTEAMRALPMIADATVDESFCSTKRRRAA
jgi:hypothetical protein